MNDLEEKEKEKEKEMTNKDGASLLDLNLRKDWNDFEKSKGFHQIKLNKWVVESMLRFQNKYEKDMAMEMNKANKDMLNKQIHEMLKDIEKEMAEMTGEDKEETTMVNDFDDKKVNRVFTDLKFNFDKVLKTNREQHHLNNEQIMCVFDLCIKDLYKSFLVARLKACDVSEIDELTSMFKEQMESYENFAEVFLEDEEGNRAND